MKFSDSRWQTERNIYMKPCFKQSLNEENLLGDLPEKLKAEIAIQVHLDKLKQEANF